MTAALRTLAASVAALVLAGSATAQGNYSGGSARGFSVAPGGGYAEVVGGQTVGGVPGRPALTPPAADGSSLQNPQPAECLGAPEGTSGPWLVVAPYAWIFGMQGTVGAGPRVQTVDLSVGDAAQAAVDDLKGAAQIHVESGYGPVGVIADLTYMRLVPLDGLVRVQSEATLFELLGMYRVIDTGRCAGGVTFDVLAGARYYRFSNSIEGNVFGLLSAERTNKWIDLVVGARAGVKVTDDLEVFARGDVGGFGIGHSSQQACNVLVGFEYWCCDCASLVGGYRWLKIDRESGVGRDRFLLDATLAGPFLAFALRY
jgi:hypothetical protein